MYVEYYIIRCVGLVIGSHTTIYYIVTFDFHIKLDVWV